MRRSSRRGPVWRYLGLALLVLLAAALVPMAVREDRNQLQAQPVPSFTANSAPRVTVFIGDSSVAGKGATRTKGRWSSMASQSLRWEEVNLAHNGSGYAPTTASGGCDGKSSCRGYSEELAEVKSRNPQVVVVGGGGPAAGGAKATQSAVKDFYRDLQLAAPSAKIIAVGPWATSSGDKSLLALDEDVQAAARSVRGVYVSLLDPLVIKTTMTTDGGRSLNDVGHQMVADRVAETIDDNKGN